MKENLYNKCFYFSKLRKRCSMQIALKICSRNEIMQAWNESSDGPSAIRSSNHAAPIQMNIIVVLYRTTSTQKKLKKTKQFNEHQKNKLYTVHTSSL